MNSLIPLAMILKIIYQIISFISQQIYDFTRYKLQNKIHIELSLDFMKQNYVSRIKNRHGDNAIFGVMNLTIRNRTTHNIMINDIKCGQNVLFARWCSVENMHLSEYVQHWHLATPSFYLCCPEDAGTYTHHNYINLPIRCHRETSFLDIVINYTTLDVKYFAKRTIHKRAILVRNRPPENAEIYYLCFKSADSTKTNSGLQKTT